MQIKNGAHPIGRTMLCIDAGLELGKTVVQLIRLIPR